QKPFTVAPEPVKLAWTGLPSKLLPRLQCNTSNPAGLLTYGGAKGSRKVLSGGRRACETDAGVRSLTFAALCAAKRVQQNFRAAEAVQLQTRTIVFREAGGIEGLAAVIPRQAVERSPPVSGAYTGRR